MVGAWGQASLGVSSSVAEGVLTPAALHLRVSAEVERQAERKGGCGVRRGTVSPASFQEALLSCRFNSHQTWWWWWCEAAALQNLHLRPRLKTLSLQMPNIKKKRLSWTISHGLTEVCWCAILKRMACAQHKQSTLICTQQMFNERQELHLSWTSPLVFNQKRVAGFELSDMFVRILILMSFFLLLSMTLCKRKK